MTNYIIFGIIAVGLLFQKAKQVKQLYVSNVRLKFDGNLINPILILTIDVVNPTNLSATVNLIEGVLTTKEKMILADLKTTKKFTISPMSTAIIQAEFNVKFINVLKSIATILQRKENIFFTGIVFTNIVNMPFNHYELK